jgi:hypothetical protein
MRLENIKEIHDGYSVRRAVWPQGEFITLDRQSVLIYYKSQTDTGRYWQGSEEDFNATDWELLPWTK